jgi:hypothetical protein
VFVVIKKYQTKENAQKKKPNQFFTFYYLIFVLLLQKKSLKFSCVVLFGALDPDYRSCRRQNVEIHDSIWAPQPRKAQSKNEAN